MASDDRHESVVAGVLEPGETLRAWAGAIASRRRRRGRDVPSRGFVLVVTDRRLIAVGASTWLARPTGIVLTSWAYDDGATLSPARFGRARLVLPDRTVVTLAPFGGWSLKRLT